MSSLCEALLTYSNNMAAVRDVHLAFVWWQWTLQCRARNFVSKYSTNTQAVFTQMVYFCVNITNIPTQILYEPLYMTTVTYGEYVKRLTAYLRKEMCHQTPWLCMHFRKNLNEWMKWHLYSADSPSLTCLLAVNGTDLTFSGSSHTHTHTHTHTHPHTHPTHTHTPHTHTHTPHTHTPHTYSHIHTYT